MDAIGRAAFHVPGPGPYLLAHSVGCLPVEAAAALQRQYLEPWMHEGGGAWEAWLGAIGGFRAALAQLFGGRADDYCPQPNLSAALVRFIGALPAPEPRRCTWLAAEDTFPSMGFALGQLERLGYRLRLIPRHHDPAEVASWLRALTPDVCGVLVMHVHSNTGTVAPVAELAAACRAREAWCVVDVAQSAGILPFDVDTLGVDAMLGSCVKWLCGGPGAGFLWVRPELLPELRPIDVGWFSHARPFEFDIHHFEYAPDARRFWGGTPSVAPYVVATAGLELIRRIGVERIRAHNQTLTAQFVDALPAAWRARVRPPPRGGTLCIDAGAALSTVTAALNGVGVRFDCRGSIVRLSFHAYNTADEAALAAQAWPTGE